MRKANLCSLLLHPLARNQPAALALCLRALAHMETAARWRPKLNGIAADLANRHSWLGSAYNIGNDDARARAQWLLQEKLLGGLMKIEPWNMQRRIDWIAVQRLLSRQDAKAGRIDQAIDRLTRASKLIEDMTLLDPENKTWAGRRSKIDEELRSLSFHHNEGSSRCPIDQPSASNRLFTLFQGKRPRFRPLFLHGRA